MEPEHDNRWRRRIKPTDARRRQKSSFRREVAQGNDCGGVEPNDKRYHQFDHMVKFGAIDDAVMRMRVTRGHDQMTVETPPAVAWIAALSSP